jgi:hypothetical protein
MHLEYFADSELDDLKLPLRTEVGEGEACFHVEDACGAPNGSREWVRYVVESARRPALFDPHDRLDEFSANPGTRQWFAKGARWAACLCLLRYRYLGSFFHVWKIKQRRPCDPALIPLWTKWKDAERAAVRARQRYLDATRLPDPALSIESRRGRRGNVTLRETTKSLVRLYSKLYGIPATDTMRGPAARFASAFFDGLTGNWRWVRAECYDDIDSEKVIYWHLVDDVQIPGQSMLRDLLRGAISNAEQQEMAVRRELSKQVFGEGLRPVSGAFALDDHEGGEKWGTADGKIPELFRLTSPGGIL